MTHQAKAPSAESTQAGGSSRGLLRRAVATRGLFGDVGGTGAPSRRRFRATLAVLALAIAAFAVTAAPALAAPPTVTTPVISNVSYTTVHVTSQLTSDGSGLFGYEEYAFQYSTDGSNWIDGPGPGEIITGPTEQPIEGTIGGLEMGTEYFVRVTAHHYSGGGGTTISPGPNPSFTTLIAEPTAVVTVDSASEVAYTTATATGKIKRPVNSDDVACHFEYIADAAYQANPEAERFAGAAAAGCEPKEFVEDIGAEVPVEAKLTNLANNTTYHLRLAVSNAANSDAKGAPSTFTTLTVDPPSVKSIEDAAEVEYTEAQLKGVVERPNTSPDTAFDVTCNFEYIAAQQFNDNPPGDEFLGATPVACEPEGNPSENPIAATGPAPVNASLSGLAPGTTYHLRLSATNVGGTDSKEAASTFTTEPIAKPTLTLDPIATHTDTTAKFSGKVETNAPAVLTPNAEAVFKTNWHLSCVPACPKLTPEGAGTVTAAEGSQTFSLDASELEPNTSYDVTLEASNGGGATKVTGTFATTLIPATIFNAPGGSDGEGGYFLEGLVNPHNSNVTSCKFVYGPTSFEDPDEYPFAVDCSPMPAGRSEVQEVHVNFASSGQVKLTFRGQSTTVSFDASAAEMEAALEALSTIGPNGVSVTASSDFFGTTYTVTYGGPLASTNLPELQIENETNGLASVSVTADGENNKLISVEGHVTGLNPNVEYHARLVVTTGAGTQHTTDQAFVPTLAEKGPECPNEELRRENGSLELPECRAYEMVTEPNKQGNRAILQDYSGDSVAYTSITGNLANSGQGVAFGINYYASARTTVGWETIPNLNGPTGSMLSGPEFVAGGNRYPLSYSADLLSSIWEVGIRDSPQGPYLRRPDGAFVLVGEGLPGNFEAALVGTSDDLSHLVSGGKGVWGPGVYEFVGTGNGQPGRVDIDNLDNPVADCVVDGRVAEGKAVSSDGRVIVFGSFGGCGGASPPANELWARVDATTSYDLSASQCGRSDCNAPADATYQGATKDGSRVYFTTTQQLVDGDEDQTNDLYACDIPTTPRDPIGTANPCAALHEASAGKDGNADVQEVLSVSDDGSTAYFTAKGVLADNEDALGEPALAGDRNLYAWRTDASHPAGHTIFVARLPESDSPRLQTTPDGRYLLLQTAGQLLLTDTDDTTDIYRYDVDAQDMARVSTAISGAGGNGPFDAKLGSMENFRVPKHNSHPSISDDGRLIVFATEEALSPLDGNGEPDAYLWNDGNALGSVGPMAPSKEANGKAPGRVTIDGSGRDIYIETATRLNPSDVDFTGDVYDARIGGGFPQRQEGCAGAAGACQSHSPERPPPPIPATAQPPTDTENVKPRKPCPKGKIRKKNGKCVKKHSKGPKHKHSHKRGGLKRGGSK